jgi:AcrR family transcriptional regulator
LADAKNDKRRTHTRANVLAEAERLYHVGGYEAITLQSIADTLEISKAALFYHFDGKQSLFFAMLNAVLDRMQIELHASRENAKGKIREHLAALLSVMTKPPTFDITRFLRSELALLSASQQKQIQRACDTKLFANIRGVFDAGITSGALRPHDTNLSAMLFMGICNALSLFNAAPATERARQAEQALDMFLVGLIK